MTFYDLGKPHVPQKKRRTLRFAFLILGGHRTVRPRRLGLVDLAPATRPPGESTKNDGKTPPILGTYGHL